MKRLSLLFLVLACASPVAPSLSHLPLRSCYAFTSTRSDASGLRMQGQMLIEGSTGATFNGSINATEPTPDGTLTPFTGSIGGQFLDDSTVDFTWNLSDPRRYLGTLRGDSISGQWFSTSNMSPALSGSYTLLLCH